MENKKQTGATDAPWVWHRDMRHWRVSLWQLLWLVLLLSVAYGPWGKTIYQQLQAPIDFKIREHLGYDPPLAANLKIYAYDDKTFAATGSPHLPLEDWLPVLQTLAAKKPRVLVIDSLLSRLWQDSAGTARFGAKLAALGIPIVSGCFASNTPVAFRDPLNDQVFKDFFARVLSTKDKAKELASYLPAGLRSEHLYTYGPDAALQPFLQHIGHLMYGNDLNMSPLLWLGDEKLIPSLPLAALAEQVSIKQRQLYFGTQRIPLDSDGQLPVNFVGKQWYYQNTRSLLPVLQKSRLGQPIDWVQPGDVVLILPQMYTGNTDFKYSPLGFMPGGFVHASVLSSMLTGRWLKPLALEPLLIALLMLVGILVGWRLESPQYWYLALATSAAFTALMVGLFVFAAVVCGWLLPLGGFWLAFLTIAAEKSRVHESRLLSLKQALEGSVSQKEVHELMRTPAAVNFAAKERVVTIMFVDVASFSLVAQHLQPRQAFDTLKEILHVVSEAVWQHGGIIDRTLGDGVLCYFGYHFADQGQPLNHTLQAFQSAVEIQQKVFSMAQEAVHTGAHVIPLRIGINTASCYLGDLGAHGRVDFTVVGSGVNLAKRLEEACDLFCVLLSDTSFQLIAGYEYVADAMRSRFIAVKHSLESLRVHEYDPCYGQGEALGQVIEAFQNFLQNRSREERFAASADTPLWVKGSFGEALVLNFSSSGVSIRSPQRLEKGQLFRFHFYLSQAVNEPARVLSQEIFADVRWGYQQGESFVHGIQFHIMDRQARTELVQLLRDATQPGSASVRLQTSA